MAFLRKAVLTGAEPLQAFRVCTEAETEQTLQCEAFPSLGNVGMGCLGCGLLPSQVSAVERSGAGQMRGFSCHPACPDCAALRANCGCC